MPIVETIDYSAQGGYNALDFAALGGVYTTPAGLGPRLGKIGMRHVGIDISGKVLMLRGVMAATRDSLSTLGGGQQSGRSLRSNTATKYAGGDVEANWREATGARLRNFHFNVVGNTSGSFNNGGGMLIFFSVGGVYDAMTRGRMQQVTPGAEPIKCLVQATDFASGSGGRQFGDVFDPKYATFVASWVGNATYPDPKIFAFWSDDGDHVSAFGGAGHPNEVGFTDPAGNYGFHAGMIALIGRPTITSQINASSQDELGGGQGYTWTADTVNHTKAALIAYLTAKYTTIGALNTAWGSTYTTFGTQGAGWGAGTGLTDEAGIVARAWLGSASTKTAPQNGGPNNLVDSTTWGLTGPLVASTYYAGSVRAMKQDLDDFMFKIFEAYLQPIHNTIKGVRTNALFAGSNGGPPGRAPGLKAINTYCDLMMGGGHYAFGDNHELNPVAAAQTDYERRTLTIPTFTSMYTGIVGDSCLYYLSPGSAETQAENGGDYQACLEAAMQYQAPNGEYPYIGGLKWGLYDQINEGVGWGLFSLNDNPYDGSDRRVAGLDPYNAVTGQTRTTLAEDRVYGNQLALVTQANREMFTIVQAQISPAAPTASFTTLQSATTLAVQFTDTSTGNPPITLRAWTFFDTNGTTVLGTSALQNPSFTYPAIGTYPTTRLTVTNALGSHTADQAVVVVQPGGGTSQTLTATTRAFTPTLYSAALNAAVASVLTATTLAVVPTFYPANVVAQTVAFSALMPIRVLQFRGGQVATIIVRAIVPFPERGHYASPGNMSLHPFASEAERVALRSGELVEELVALPNPKAILTYAQLKPLAEAAQTAFRDKVTQSVYGAMAGVDGQLTTFDGTTWT